VPSRELDDRRLASRGQGEPAEPLEMVNEWDKFLIRIESQAPIWRYPLEAASQSEGGFERTYQGSTLLPFFRDLQLGDGKTFETRITIELVQL
jgi:hypothetical protein